MSKTSLAARDGALNDTPSRVYSGGFDKTLYLNSKFGVWQFHFIRLSVPSFASVRGQFQMLCSIFCAKGVFPH